MVGERIVRQNRLVGELRPQLECVGAVAAGATLEPALVIQNEQELLLYNPVHI